MFGTSILGFRRSRFSPSKPGELKIRRPEFPKKREDKVVWYNGKRAKNVWNFGIHIHGVCIEPEVKALKADVAFFYSFAGPNAAEQKKICRTGLRSVHRSGI